MTLVTIGDYTFNPEAIDLVKGDREDYCEVFFRNGERVEFHMSQSSFKGAVLEASLAPHHLIFMCAVATTASSINSRPPSTFQMDNSA